MLPGDSFVGVGTSHFSPHPHGGIGCGTKIVIVSCVFLGSGFCFIPLNDIVLFPGMQLKYWCPFD